MGAARRLRVLAGSLAGGASSSPSAAQITEDGASITELDAPALLSDADVKQFLVDGCLALPMTDLPVGFHRELQAKSRAGFESLRAEGITEDRYVYEQLPAMSDILSSPVLRGALISLLGEGYVQHPHRSMHVQGDIEDEEPRLGDGGWCRPNRRPRAGGEANGVGVCRHKDGHHVPMRHHFPRWIIGFYYPYPCTLDMGPSEYAMVCLRESCSNADVAATAGLIPGSHWLSEGTYNDGGWSGDEGGAIDLPDSADPVARHDAQLAAAAAARFPGASERKTAVGDLCHPTSGTIFLLNFGILHRRCTRLPGSLWRNMFKLQFFRASAPAAPSWDHKPDGGSEPPFAYTGASAAQQSVFEAGWNWMCGASPAPPSPSLPSVEALAPQLGAEAKEYDRVASAYALGQRVADGDAAAEAVLGEALQGSDDDASRSAMYGETHVRKRRERPYSYVCV